MKLKKNAGIRPAKRVPRPRYFANDAAVRDPGLYSQSFLAMLLRQRVRTLIKIRKEAAGLTALSENVENPHDPNELYADKVAKAAKRGKEEQALKIFEKFAMQCEAIFQLARKNFQMRICNTYFCSTASQDRHLLQISIMHI